MPSIPWQENHRVPRGVGAVLAALQFRDASHEPLESLDEQDWQGILAFCDREQLTLTLGGVCRDGLPKFIRGRIDRNLHDNSERLERHKQAFFEIAGALRAAGVEHLMLKGFTQWPHFVADPRFRVQWDLDFFCPPEQVFKMRDALLELGYEPYGRFKTHPTDHLPTMIRRIPWQWSGNFFDPTIPVSVELHFRFWDEETERIGAPGLDQFWSRRVTQVLDGFSIPLLHPADALGYASLHMLRHLLRGSLRLYHAYEIAYFLDSHAQDDAFWELWRDWHEAPVRRLEAICFRLAASWFNCRLSPVAQEDVELLPDDIQLWLRLYSASPVEALFHPNKDELWLHFCLLQSFGDRCKVFLRRTLPTRMPAPVESGYILDEQRTWPVRWRMTVKYFAHVGVRLIHHLRSVAPTFWHGICWRWRLSSLGKPYGIFLGTVCLYNAGQFIFLVLYNLFLLDRGYREAFLGLVASAFTFGSIAGTLPAAALIRRFGLRGALIVASVGTAAVSALRCLVVGRTPLVVAAFLGGMAFSTLAVSAPPAVAALSQPKTRAFAFSLFFATCIAVGIVAGLAGGYLPALAGSKQAALLISCVLTALAVWPATRLRLPSPMHREQKSYPRTPFVRRFLVAVGLWNLGTGCFNPFFNAYFARFWQLPVDRIGMIFSGAQLAQVGAILLAPLAIRGLGLVGGIASMQLATAVALACVGAAPAASTAALAYLTGMAFQWMSEPGLNTLLMNQVEAPQRSGASAMNVFIVFGCQAVAAAGAGVVITRFGYPVMLGIAATLAAGSALLFRVLLRKFETRQGVL